jgi:hypothetical protein
MAHSKHFAAASNGGGSSSVSAPADDKLSTAIDTGDILSFMGISPAQLLAAGLSKELVRRVFVALWVYGVGFHEILNEISKQCGQSKRTNGVLANVWKVFVVLLEGYHTRDYVMAITQVEKKSEELLESVAQRLGKQVALVVEREKEHIVERDRAVEGLRVAHVELDALRVEKKEVIEQWNSLHMRHQAAVGDAARLKELMANRGDRYAKQSDVVEDLRLHIQELNTQIVTTVQHWREQNKILKGEANNALKQKCQDKQALEAKERELRHQTVVSQQLEHDKQRLEMEVTVLLSKSESLDKQLAPYSDDGGYFKEQIAALEEAQTGLIEQHKQDEAVLAVVRKLFATEKETSAAKTSAFEDLLREKDVELARLQAVVADTKYATDPSTMVVPAAARKTKISRLSPSRRGRSRSRSLGKLNSKDGEAQDDEAKNKRIKSRSRGRSKSKSPKGESKPIAAAKGSSHLKLPSSPRDGLTKRRDSTDVPSQKSGANRVQWGSPDATEVLTSGETIQLAVSLSLSRGDAVSEGSSANWQEGGLPRRGSFSKSTHSRNNREQDPALTAAADYAFELGKLKTRLCAADLQRKLLMEGREEAQAKLAAVSTRCNRATDEWQRSSVALLALQRQHRQSTAESEFELGKLRDEVIGLSKSLKDSDARHANRVSEQVLQARTQMHQEAHKKLELQNEMNAMKKNLATLSGDLRKSRMEASHAKELAKSMRQDIKRLREKLFRAEQDIAEKEALHSREREEQRSRECEELRSEGDARQELLKTTHAQVIQISELTDELEKNRLDILAMKAQQQNDLKTVQEEAEDQRVTHLQKEKAIRKMLDANNELLRVKKAELEEAQARALMMENVVLEERAQFAEIQTAMRAKLQQHAAVPG